MAISISNDTYLTHQQIVRKLNCRISLLNVNDIKVAEITGLIINSSYSFNSQSAIRRSGNISMLLDDKSFIPQYGGKIWIGAKCKLEIGIEKLLTDEIIYNNLGIYLIDEPILTYGLTERKIELKLYDKMCLLNGTRNGKLKAKTKITAGTNISTAIKTTVINLGGIAESYTNIEYTSNTVPEDIEVEAGTTVLDLLKSLRDLYMGFEMYFNEDGIFRFQSLKSKTTDQIVYNFKEERDLHSSYSIDLDWQYVKNDITIWGKTNDDGTQYVGHAVDTDSTSKFNVNQPCGHLYHVDTNDNLSTQAQVNAEAKYYLWKYTSFNDKITIECLPIYYLRENNVIYCYDEELGIDGKYVINQVSCGLGANDKMVITAYACRDNNIANE